MLAIDLSNYWDNFSERVAQTIDALEAGGNPPLQRLNIHLTDKCNLRCNYCNMSFTPHTMPQETVMRLIDEYAEMPGDKKLLHLTGGEPTVVPYFEEVCAYAKSRGMDISVNTNGVKRIDTSNIDKVKVSFDTCDPDEFDRVVGVKGAFNKVCENLRIYSYEMKGKMLSLTAVLNKNTYKDMLPLAKFVNDNFDVYNLYFSNYKGHDPEMAFTDEEIEELFGEYFPQVHDYFIETGSDYSAKQVDIYVPEAFEDTLCRYDLNKKIPCYIQLSEMTVDVLGNCYNCSHLYRDGVTPKVQANINDMSLSEAFDKKKGSFECADDMVCLSEKCLDGCNPNLIAFNYAVHSGERV